jgi:hypothetical protein
MRRGPGRGVKNTTSETGKPPPKHLFSLSSLNEERAGERS